MIAYNNIFIFTICFAFAATIPVKEGCDTSQCKGPINFYGEIGCTPIYKKPDDCCPYKFNCDNWKNRETNKCYINGRQYNIGDELKDEDKNQCDTNCVCREGNGIAQFVCAIHDCFTRFKEGCYNPHDASQCCPGEAICPENPEDIPKCEVDGKTYTGGQYFSPSAEPEKDCWCGEGYKGENISPFCKVRNHPICGTELRHANDIHEKCIPYFYNGQSPQKDCSVAYRCQSPKDEVIKRSSSSESKSSESSEEKSDDMKCMFGNLEMQIGDELNQEPGDGSTRMKCICEVPPIPTCQQIPDAR